MVLRRLMKAAGFLKDPAPTTTAIDVETLAGLVDGIVRGTPVKLPTDQDYNRNPTIGALYYQIGNDIEALIGEGGAYNRPEGMDDDRFRFIRAVKGIGNALSEQETAQETVEIDNDILIDFRDSLYQLKMLSPPPEDDPTIARINTELNQAWTALSMLAETKADVYAAIQTFTARAEETLKPLLAEVTPNPKKQRFDDEDQRFNDGGSRDWDLF